MASITTAAVMFTDVVDSTGLRARLGTARADALFDVHFRLVAEVLTTFDGEEVKRLGDGVMATFNAVSTAVDCAVALQQAVQSAARARPDAAAIRIGLSVGEMKMDGGDYSGLPVIEASRLCATANAGQVLCSAVTAHLAAAHGRHPFRPVGARTFKGFGEPIEVMEVIWTPTVDRGLVADFTRVDESDNPDEIIRVLDHMREAPFFTEVRERVFECIAPRPGQRLLDVGSGTGDDVVALASHVGASGFVVGVDLSEMLVTEATRRAAATSVGNVEFRTGEARALPFEDQTFDGTYSQRTFQYLNAPLVAVREMARVTRPGGCVVVADTDWETAVFGSDDEELTARITRAWCDTRPSGRIGHQLYGLFRRAGVEDVTVFAHTQVVTELDDFSAATARLIAAQAVSSEAVTEAEASRWLAEIDIAAREDRYLRSLTMFVTAGRAARHPQPSG
jgi:ubiquinone/menaquinone biosynthesis C-methylase UbiE/class 3 adenylate cyclase